MAEALKRPGGELASRPLHFFWVVDCSGSMYGEKIGTVNHAIQSTIPEMVDAAKDNPNAQLLVRTLKFSTGATWVTPNPVNIEDFAWDDLDAGGVTGRGPSAQPRHRRQQDQQQRPDLARRPAGIRQIDPAPAAFVPIEHLVCRRSQRLTQRRQQHQAQHRYRYR